MSPTRPLSPALALLLAGGLLLPARAEALNIFVAKLDFQTTSEDLQTFQVTLDGGEQGATAVEVRVSSDGGSEDLELTESNAWLHGSVTLAALPAKDTTLTLTLLDEVSASWMTFSGTLTAEGVVTFDAGKASGGCVSDSKAGCTAEEPDVEVLASALYPSGKGYVLSLDLAGADTYAVAYAVVAVTGGEKAEVGFDAVGSVWTAEATLAHTGVIDVKAKARDEAGRTLANVHAELEEPWADDGAGVVVLSAGKGTGLAISRWDDDYKGTTPWSWTGSREMVTVVSDGWTTTSYPTHAEVELGGSATATIPANSYHRHGISGGNLQITDNARFSITDSSISISGGNLNFKPQSPTDLGSSQCSSGYCVAIVEAEKGYELSVSTYGTTPAKLPAKQDFDLVLYDKSGAKVASERAAVTFDPAVTAVFVSAVDVSGDPIGADASGSVRLLAPSTKKGKSGVQDVLTSGSFFGSLSRDQDGDLGLGGYGTDEAATAESTASIDLGEPVLCGGAGCDGDWTPPVVLFGRGGKVTKIVVSSGGLDY